MFARSSRTLPRRRHLAMVAGGGPSSGTGAMAGQAPQTWHCLLLPQGCNPCWRPWACWPWQARGCCYRGWEACQGRVDTELLRPYFQACFQEVPEICPACFVAKDCTPDASRQGFGTSWPRDSWRGPSLFLDSICDHGQVTPEAGWQAQGNTAPG